MKMQLKQKIYYTGDMANADGFGEIAAVRPAGKYGPESYDVKLEDGREFRGVYPSMFDAGPGRRFWPRDEWHADRQKKIEQMQASFKRLQAGEI